MFSYLEGNKSYFLSIEINQCEIWKFERIKDIFLNKGKDRSDSI